MRCRKGQQTTSLPFGIIFAIFLIVVFVVIAFIAISHFLDIGRQTGVGMFYEDLQTEVESAWKSQSVDKSFEIDLPDSITHVCFANLSEGGSGPMYEQIKNFYLYDANTFLIPPENAEGMGYKLIEHLDIEEMTKSKNPYCVEAGETLRIKKDFYSKLVILE